jgi:Acetoacetate decarboxylase (ADC)
LSAEAAVVRALRVSVEKQAERGREMSGELFKGVKKWDSEQAGVKFRLPFFSYDNASLTAIYTASTRKARKLLPHPAMNPIEMFPGRCLVAFSAFEYRKPDIDPYNEFSIAFLITFGERQIPGMTVLRQMARRCFTAYTWQLPVTTEMARFLGIELYGYPKFLADITFDKGEEWIECRLSEKGEEILTLKGKVLPTSKGKGMTYATYSVIDQIPVKANMVTNPLEYAQTWNRRAATLTIGANHPVSKTLREIDLSPNPVMYQFSPRTEAILFGAKNLIDT